MSDEELRCILVELGQSLGVDRPSRFAICAFKVIQAVEDRVVIRIQRMV